MFFYTPSEVCRSCIFPILSAFYHYWWPLNLLFVKKRCFRISPCLVMCKRDFNMQNRQLYLQNRQRYVVFSRYLQKISHYKCIIDKHMICSLKKTHIKLFECNFMLLIAHRFCNPQNSFSAWFNIYFDGYNIVDRQNNFCNESDWTFSIHGLTDSQRVKQS